MTQKERAREQKLFISYARADRSRVTQLESALEERGLSAWWDRELRGGESFSRAIEEKLDASRCVLVIWTQHSVESDWVRAEAGAAHEQGKLIPILIGKAVRIPLPFRELHTINLSDWDGDAYSDEFERLAQNIASKIGAPVEPGDQVRKPFWRTRRGHRIMIAIGAVALSAVLFLVALYGIRQNAWPVVLRSPQDGATIAQPFQWDWTFTWDEPKDPREIRRYHLVVTGGAAAIPSIDIKTLETSYEQMRACSFIVDENLSPWRWRVRAQYADGTWGDWSEDSIFHVEQMNRTVFCQQCPSASDCVRQREASQISGEQLQVIRDQIDEAMAELRPVTSFVTIGSFRPEQVCRAGQLLERILENKSLSRSGFEQNERESAFSLTTPALSPVGG